MNKIKNILKRMKNPERVYLKAWYNLEIKDKCILLEAGQGKNINGNMFAILKEIETNPKWDDITPYFVVTKKTKKDAYKRFAFYRFHKVRMIVRNSREYQKLLATCKYLMTDNSFPPYFSKRKEQLYLNTWHGTPLKYLGRSDVKNAVSLGNIQKNFFACDYALFPNTYTRDIFMYDYMLEHLYSGQMLLTYYPRNSVFLDTNQRKKLRETFQVSDKKVIAYMPTWRGVGRKADNNEQTEIISKYLIQMDKELEESEVLYVNLHFLVSNHLDFNQFKKIKPFPKEYETYEFLNICDILITDYSSVFFDFAVTKRKIILFTYDFEEYMKEKGTYMDMALLPFAQVDDIKELFREIRNASNIDYADFINTYCKYAAKNQSEKILELLVNGQDEGLVIEAAPKNNRKNHVIHAGTLIGIQLQERIKEKIEASDKKTENTIITFEGGINQKKSDFLQKLPRDISYVSIVNGFADGNTLRENNRLFPGWHVDESEILRPSNERFQNIFKEFQTDSVGIIKTKKQKFEMTEDGLKLFFDVLGGDPTWEFQINETIFGSDWQKETCSITIPISNLLKLEPKNRLYFIDENGMKYKIRNKNKLKKYLAVLAEKIFLIEKESLACYFLENEGILTLTVRQINVTDSKKERRKIRNAFILSKISPWEKPILLFEKNSERYEESGSVVYERMIDEGYRNVYFILDRNSHYWNVPKSQYKKNIIEKYSFKHYLYFFKAQTFIGSEAMAHAIELRPISKYIRYHLIKGKYHYVFLQHGIMYMISLDAESRGFFAPKKKKGINRTVVSSQAEADHFVQLGGYKPDSLYLCGLPKYDRNVLKKDADKIVIMPTWRPWEQVEGTMDFCGTGYYNMIQMICDAIPKHLKNKIVVLPHPLLAKLFPKDNEISKYIAATESYESILQNTNLLITDYSSISFDAFYRGSNVIFYWKEKEACLKKYGSNAKLMLTEELAFGDICYDGRQLTESILRNYNAPQNPGYLKRYSKLVEFHDGKNTERLMDMLKKDGLI